MKDPGPKGTVHKVHQGESVDSLAFEYGHLGQHIWNDSANNALREKRIDSRVLAPGDALYIPAREPKHFDGCATDRRHVFRRKGVPSLLRFHPTALSGQGMAKRFEVLENDTITGQGTPDSQGDIVWPLNPNAPELVIRVYFDSFYRDYQVKPRILDPIDTISGIQQRLASLGFYTAPTTGTMNDDTIAALGAFKMSYGLYSEALLDDKVKDALYCAFGEDVS